MFFACVPARMPIHLMLWPKRPATSCELAGRSHAFGSSGCWLDTVSHSWQAPPLPVRPKRPVKFVPEPVWYKCTSNRCLTISRGHIQNRVFSVYARGFSPSPLPPQVEQYGQFSHISTCITLCTSHNWSTTVTGYIRCFSTYFLHRFYAINVT